MPLDCCHDNACCRWAVGSNMPGYMPDAPVSHFETWKDARDAFIEDVDRAVDDEADAHENGTGSEFDALEWEWADFLASLLQATECDVEFRVGRYVYWIARTARPC